MAAELWWYREARRQASHPLLSVPEFDGYCSGVPGGLRKFSTAQLIEYQLMAAELWPVDREMAKFKPEDEDFVSRF